MTLPDYFELLRLAGPEVVLVLAVLAVLFLDLAVMRNEERGLRRRVALAVVVVGGFAAGFLAWQMEPGTAPAGMLTMDALTRWVKIALVGLTLLAVAVSVDSDFTEHVGEFHALLLLAALGMMFLAGAENLLMIFVALELTSLPLYVLTAFDKRNPRSAEAALKYFLYGGTAAALLLFGLSLLYGATATLELRPMATALAGRPLDPFLATALVMIAAGLGFKIAAVPFHLWAPETYEGAPTAVAGFIASGSKVAAFFVLARLLYVGWSGQEGSAGWRALEPGWGPLMAVMAAFSMVLGNLAALTQSHVKRLLAFSAVAHAGYTLVGLASGTLAGVVAVVYYTVTYALAVLGALSVTLLVEKGGRPARLTDFAGLARRSPVMALCLMFFVLSLAGIPPMAGFFGKFQLFAAALGGGLDLGLLWLVILAVLMSAVSLYYYLMILKQAYVVPAPAEAPEIRPGLVFQLAVVVLGIATLLLGALPDILVAPFSAAVSAW